MSRARAESTSQFSRDRASAEYSRMPLCMNAGRRAHLVEREQERDAVHEMGRDHRRQRAPFVVGLPHEAHIAQAQVAKAAVNQLRGGARRPASEVACVDERNGETGAGSVRGDRGADDATAGDEQVEAAPRELLQSSSTRYVGPDLSGPYTAIGFAHAFLPTESVTSTRT